MSMRETGVERVFVGKYLVQLWSVHDVFLCPNQHTLDQRFSTEGTRLAGVDSSVGQNPTFPHIIAVAV